MPRVFVVLPLSSRITKYICSSSTPNLLSVRYPTSLVRKLTSFRFGKRHVKAAGLLLMQIKTPPKEVFLFALPLSAHKPTWLATFHNEDV